MKPSPKPRCSNCNDNHEDTILYRYGGEWFCYFCLSEHFNDTFELRNLAIEEYIKSNCRIWEEK